jgi:hypothetical protein
MLVYRASDDVIYKVFTDQYVQKACVGTHRLLTFSKRPLEENEAARKTSQ